MYLDLTGGLNNSKLFEHGSPDFGHTGLSSQADLN